MSATKGERYKIDMARPVKVYWNLHKHRFSVQQDGLVKAHLSRVWLQDAHFVVNEAGRQRVLKERRKNVHAFVTGVMDVAIVGTRLIQDGQRIKVRYNPYEMATFQDELHREIHFAGMVKLEDRKIVAWI